MLFVIILTALAVCWRVVVCVPLNEHTDKQFTELPIPSWATYTTDGILRPAHHRLDHFRPQISHKMLHMLMISTVVDLNTVNQCAITTTAPVLLR